MDLNIRKVKVSIIIPVYNVEKYLKKCLDTVKAQTYKNIEIIMVNDGSNDGSKEICEYYKKKDCRFKLINKENGGLSSARNVGIRNSLGDLLFFVDSDDYIPPNAIEILVANYLNKECDVVIGKIADVQDGIVSGICGGSVSYIDKNTCLQEMLLGKKITHSASGKLYKKELFSRISYPEGKLFEDLFTTYEVINKALDICFIDKVVYYYVHRSNSILTSKNNLIKKCNDLYDASEYLVHFFSHNKNLLYYAIDKSVYQNMLVIDYASKIDNYQTKKEIIKKSKKFMKKNFYNVFKSKAMKSTTKIKYLLYLIGFKNI